MPKNFLIKIYELFHSALFPKRCAGCDKKETYLCENCKGDIFILGQYNEKSILSAVSYHDPVVKKLIRLLKYHGVKEVAEILADWVYDTLLEELAEVSAYREQGGKILVIPVPLSVKRKRSRGFNQAEEIAMRLVERDPQLFRLENNNLLKIKDTKTQVSVKSRSERLNNLKGAFSLKNKNALRGRTVIILDDVTTTGTTLSEVANVVARGKPRKIIKVAVAGR